MHIKQQLFYYHACAYFLNENVKFDATSKHIDLLKWVKGKNYISLYNVWFKMEHYDECAVKMHQNVDA